MPKSKVAQKAKQATRSKQVEQPNVLGTLTPLLDVTASIARHLEKAQIGEYVDLLRSPRKLIWRNVLAGIARGVGIALGFTFFSAVIVVVLQQLGALNLPIIGAYIARLVEIVQVQLRP